MNDSMILLLFLDGFVAVAVSLLVTREVRLSAIDKKRQFLRDKAFLAVNQNPDVETLQERQVLTLQA